MIAKSVQSRVGKRAASRRVGPGVRTALYGEMAAAASGRRPWWGGHTDWDAALVGAIRFVETGGFDAITCRSLLREAAELRMAGELHEWETPAAAVCERLASEFRAEAASR